MTNEMSSDADLIVTVRVKNARLYRAIKATGVKSVAEFCRKNALSIQAVNELICMRKSPCRKDGEWTPIAYFLSAALHIDPEMLWPEWMTAIENKRKELTFETTIGGMDALLIDRLKAAVAHLPERQQKAIKLRYLDDELTLRECGEQLNVGPERMRQIEAKIIRHMRWISHKENWVPVGTSLNEVLEQNAN